MPLLVGFDLADTQTTYEEEHKISWGKPTIYLLHGEEEKRLCEVNGYTLNNTAVL